MSPSTTTSWRSGSRTSDVEGRIDDLYDRALETMENAIQSQMLNGVDEFRQALIDAHVRLKEFRERFASAVGVSGRAGRPCQNW